MTTIVECSSLHFTQGTSDKEYHAEIIAVGSEYEVHFRYGRRGSALTSGKKTQAPVSLDQARKVYQRLLSEKRAKGYTEGESGTPFEGDSTGKVASGFVPQLLAEARAEDLDALLDSDEWVMQVKADGERRAIKIENGTSIGINKKGLEVAIPRSLGDSARCLTVISPTLLDGEQVGDRLKVFDVLEHDGQCLRERTYGERLTYLERLRPYGHAFDFVTTVRGRAAKREEFARLKAEGAEGVVFKRLGSTYRAGRGDEMRKWKFYATATVFVGAISASKRSVTVRVLDGTGNLIDRGNVTIAPNQAMPRPGDISEIRYLYCNGPDGNFYQPVYLMTRNDADLADVASVFDLKFKRDEALAVA